MAMGRSHDRATQLLALPFGLLWTPWLGWPGLAVAASAFLVGGLWLSPDLDTRSLSTRRWGPLRVLWWPYRHLIRHRSILSHSPLLGTLLRLVYLALIAFAVLVAMLAVSGPSLDQAVNWLLKLWHDHTGLVVAGLVGVEASSWLHLLQDGDPMPRLSFKPLGWRTQHWKWLLPSAKKHARRGKAWPGRKAKGPRTPRR
jgi:uncharacterized metal-binding protein